MIEVSQEFIEENLRQFTPKSCRRGPYSKHDKKARRDAIYKMHFDQGWSSRKIEEVTGITRNTINADLQFWYSRIASEYTLDPEIRVYESLTRLKLQRQRLREKLDKSISITEQITIERLLFDIESKLTNIELRLMESLIKTGERAVELANNKLRQDGHKFRVISVLDMVRCSHSTNEKIMKLIREDKRVGSYSK